MILSTQDHRIFTCHHGSISHELSLDHLIVSIHSYLTIENERLFLFVKEDHPTIAIFQCHEDLTLTAYTNTPETADRILIDDFTQIGWKQILFLKTPCDFDAFLLTDFSQIHSFQHGSDYPYNVRHEFSQEPTSDSCFLAGRKAPLHGNRRRRGYSNEFTSRSRYPSKENHRKRDN